jgi:hypothetical protein
LDPIDDQRKVEEQIAKLRALLDTHGIPMHSPKTLVLVNLREQNDKPKVYFMEYEPDNKMNVRPYDETGPAQFF